MYIDMPYPHWPNVMMSLDLPPFHPRQSVGYLRVIVFQRSLSENGEVMATVEKVNRKRN